MDWIGCFLLRSLVLLEHLAVLKSIKNCEADDHWREGCGGEDDEVEGGL